MNNRAFWRKLVGWIDGSGLGFRRLLPLIMLFATAGSASGLANASDPPLKTVPDTVTKGSTQPIRIEWPTDEGLQKAKTVTVGGQKITIPSDAGRTKQSFTVTLPAIDVTGVADVKVLDDKDQTIASGTLKYVATSETSANPKVEERPANPWLLVAYVLLIVLFPFVLMFTDILKAYKHAHTSHELIIGKFSVDKLTLDEMKVLVADLEESPPGIPGLARATFAFTLLLVIAIFLFHALVVSKSDIPPGVDKMLILLGTALTSIIAFYFGAKASEGGQALGQKADTSTTPAPVKKPSPSVTPDPNQGKAGDVIKLTGGGFGPNQGNVLFGSVPATELPGWSDTQVTVKVPSGVKPGPTKITVTPQGGQAITSDDSAFTAS
jgi:IPT/TIG domain-containing protein